MKIVRTLSEKEWRRFLEFIARGTSHIPDKGMDLDRSVPRKSAGLVAKDIPAGKESQ